MLSTLIPFSEPQGPEATTLLDLLMLAEPLAQQFFRAPLSVETKADDSPVTQADRAIEAAMRALLATRHGGDGVFGEEGGVSGPRSRQWVLDPIDGTQAFMHGNPLYGHLVAFTQDGVPSLGGVGLSALSEMLVGATGGGAWHGRPGQWKPARTRTTQSLQEATLLSTSPELFSAADRPRFDAVAAAARYRRYGGDCFTYVSVAAGWADLVVESGLKPYDYLPLVPIVAEAGGVITDWQGSPLTLDSDGRVIAAATAALHAEAVALLAA